MIGSALHKSLMTSKKSINTRIITYWLGQKLLQKNRLVVATSQKMQLNSTFSSSMWKKKRLRTLRKRRFLTR